MLEVDEVRRGAIDMCVCARCFLQQVQFDKSREKDLKALFDGTSTTAVTEATTILTNFLFTCFCTEVVRSNMATH